MVIHDKHVQHIVLLFTMPTSSALRTVFGRNVSSPLPHASLNLTATLFFPLSIKNVLFLSHCVKTWQSHPVYVCVHWNNLPSPEGLSGLFSYICWNSVWCTSHCMHTQLCNAVRQAWGHWARMAGPITLPLISPFFLIFPPVVVFTMGRGALDYDGSWCLPVTMKNAK